MFVPSIFLSSGKICIVFIWGIYFMFRTGLFTEETSRDDGAVNVDDDRQSLDAVSECSEISNVEKDPTEDNLAEACSAANVEESKESKTSDLSKEKSFCDNDANHHDHSINNFLIASDSIMGDDEEEVECVETEVVSWNVFSHCVIVHGFCFRTLLVG